MASLTKLLAVFSDKTFLLALIKFGVAAAVEHTGMLRDKRYGTIIDVGANRGQFSLVARRHQPSARLFAFEPLAVPARIYRSLFESDKKVNLQQVAIGPKTAKTEMYVSRRDDSSSLLPISEIQEKYYPGTYAVAQEEVAMVRLDEAIPLHFLEGPVLLKIDVQGSELEVLKSATKLLSLVDSVYVEASLVSFYKGQALFPEVFNFLLKENFQLQYISNPSIDTKNNTLLQADFYFERMRTKAQ